MKSCFLITVLTAMLSSFVDDKAEAQNSTNVFLGPSTNFVAHGERLYLVGTNLAPGERIIGMDSISHDGEYVLYADTNGNLHADITDPNRWNCSQNYEFYGQTTNAFFHVFYADGNQGPPESKIYSISTAPLTNGTREVDLKASVKPYFLYWIESSTNLSGPWSIIGDYYPEYEGITNISASFQVPESQRFFRIASKCD